MTGYERDQREQAYRQTVRDVWTQPLEQAVLKVDTRRPTRNGLVSINMPPFKGRVAAGWEARGQDLAQLLTAAAAIRQQRALSRQPQDRGS